MNKLINELKTKGFKYNEICVLLSKKGNSTLSIGGCDCESVSCNNSNCTEFLYWITIEDGFYILNSSHSGMGTGCFSVMDPSQNLCKLEVKQ